jgi:hypothetical protein
MTVAEASAANLESFFVETQRFVELTRPVRQSTGRPARRGQHDCHVLFCFHHSLCRPTLHGTGLGSDRPDNPGIRSNRAGPGSPRAGAGLVRALRDEDAEALRNRQAGCGPEPGPLWSHSEPEQGPFLACHGPGSEPGVSRMNGAAHSSPQTAGDGRASPQAASCLGRLAYRLVKSLHSMTLQSKLCNALINRNFAIEARFASRPGPGRTSTGGLMAAQRVERGREKGESEPDPPS